VFVIVCIAAAFGGVIFKWTRIRSRRFRNTGIYVADNIKSHGFVESRPTIQLATATVKSMDVAGLLLKKAKRFAVAILPHPLVRVTL